MEDKDTEAPAPEVPVRMATKGLGWSGRETGDELEGELLREDTPDGAGAPLPVGRLQPAQKKPAGPPMGPGMARPEVERFGEAEVEPVFDLSGVADPLTEIPDDTVVEAGRLFTDSRIFEVLDDLDRDLVALEVVKRRVREIASLLLIDRLRRTMNLEADQPTLHMSFTGNPGTGKTTVAMKMGQILWKLGYVRKGHIVVASRDDLVGQYVGHTAPKTREVLKRAMGGVLFIDEAYNIYRLDNERDYGQETVEMLLQVMENNRQDLVVIMAGYKDKMNRFFGDVPGISSRIAHHLDFPDYSMDELMAIARLMLATQRYRFTPDAERAFQEYMELRKSQRNFANGRSVRNALERLRMRQAIRLFESASSGRKLTKGDLVTIHAEDVLKSRVFEGGVFDEDAVPEGTTASA
jgi:probable Rubsico expression protein CbbX